jgi:hypothetical protein
MTSNIHLHDVLPNDSYSISWNLTHYVASLSSSFTYSSYMLTIQLPTTIIPGMYKVLMTGMTDSLYLFYNTQWYSFDEAFLTPGSTIMFQRIGSPRAINGS